MWKLTERPEESTAIRCDRVDFPPGGVAYRHTHPGPRLRVLLHGRIRIDTQGESRECGPADEGKPKLPRVRVYLEQPL